MSKAEERALEIYPVLSLTDDINGAKRKYFIDGYILAEEDAKEEVIERLSKQWDNGYNIGYGQAEKDFMEKACFWLECNLANLSKDDREFWIEDFKQAMISE